VRSILILGLVALGVAGCGKSPGERLGEAAISAATGHKVDVDENGGKVTFKTDQGEMQVASGASATLPADFPKDVYLPARYTVESVMQMPNAQVLALDTSGDIASMFADASKRMQAEGWKQTMAMQQTASTQMLAFEKDQRSAMLTFNAEGDAVKVGLQLTKKD
jgi:hypothetical protein